MNVARDELLSVGIEIVDGIAIDIHLEQKKSECAVQEMILVVFVVVRVCRARVSLSSVLLLAFERTRALSSSSAASQRTLTPADRRRTTTG